MTFKWPSVLIRWNPDQTYFTKYKSLKRISNVSVINGSTKRCSVCDMLGYDVNTMTMKIQSCETIFHLMFWFCSSSYYNLYSWWAKILFPHIFWINFDDAYHGKFWYLLKHYKLMTPFGNLSILFVSLKGYWLPFYFKMFYALK